MHRRADHDSHSVLSPAVTTNCSVLAFVSEDIARLLSPFGRALVLLVPAGVLNSAADGSLHALSPPRKHLCAGRTHPSLTPKTDCIPTGANVLLPGLVGKRRSKRSSSPPSFVTKRSRRGPPIHHASQKP
jgi:hypothetical protein